jgi:hypothetical protein
MDRRQFINGTAATLAAMNAESVWGRNPRGYPIGIQTTLPPTFSPGAGTDTSIQHVTLSCLTPFAVIYYTTDGSTPTTASTIYTGSLTVSATETIKAIAKAPGAAQSTVASALYTINLTTTATPTFAPPAGTYSSAQTVAISCATPSSTIYYTTNGTTPTTSSPVYTGPISVSGTATVKAIATASGFLQSAVGSATYTIVTSSQYMGGNFGGVGSTEQPYLNLLNSGQGFAQFSGWSVNGTTTYPQLYAVLDANGYPTSLPGGNEITVFLDSSLNDQDPLNANGSGIGNGPPPGAATVYPSGSYTIQFQGACTLVLGRDAVSGSLATSSTNVSVTGLTITSTMTSGQSGVVTFNVNSPSTSGLTLNITALPSGTNYFRNASIVRSSQVANYNAGARFDPNWIASVTNNGAGGYRRLRFMDDSAMAGSFSDTVYGNLYLCQVPALTTGSSLTQTLSTAWTGPPGTYPCVLGADNAADHGQNNTVTLTYQSTVAVFGSAFTGSVTGGATNLWVQLFSGWSTRNTSSGIFWGNANGNGTPAMMPYETAIAMCNATNTDCWLNVPLWANSFVAGGPHPFWTSLAQLVQTNLNPGLKCYLEIGNEIFIEPDEHYCNMLAFTMFGVQDYTAFLGLQYALMSQAFQAVFGSSFASTIMVGPTTEFSTGNGVSALVGQMNGVSINGGVYPNSFLAAKPYTYFTHWSVAPYWGSANSADFVTMMGTTTPLDDFFACCYGNVGTSANGSHTYASASAVVNGTTVNGWINITLAVLTYMKSAVASQPWASLPVHSYESGPGFSTAGFSNAASSYTGPYGGGSYTTIRSAGTALCLNANRDPRMGYALYDPTHQLSSNPGFLPAAIAAGLTTMNYFDDCLSESAFGPWGALSSVMQLPSSGGSGTAASYPKYAAIMQYIKPSIAMTIPNITSLSATYPSANTTAFTAQNVLAMAANTKFLDAVTGTTMWKITANGTPASDQFCPWYSNLGLAISQPWGPNLDQYHIAFISATSGAGYICDFGPSWSSNPVGAYNFRTLPAILGSYSGTSSPFSRKASNPHIMYSLTSAGVMRLYNCAGVNGTGAGLNPTTGAGYVDSSAASLGYSASWPSTGWPWNTGIDQWLMINAQETWATANNSNGAKTTIYTLNLTNGTAATISSSTVGSLDDTYVGYGQPTTNNCFSGDVPPGQAYSYNLDTSAVLPANPALTTSNWVGYNGFSHQASLNGYWTALESNKGGGTMQILKLRGDGTDNANSNILWPKYWGQYHMCGHWWTQGSGTNQFMLISMDWVSGSSLPSGWSSTENYALSFVNPDTGNTYRLGFHYSVSGQSGGNVAAGTGVGFTGSPGGASQYYSQAHASISHDGKLVIFGSNMGNQARIDLFVAEVPLIAGTPGTFP